MTSARRACCDSAIATGAGRDPGGVPGLTAEDVGRHLNIRVSGSSNVTRATWPHLVEAPIPQPKKD